MDNLVFLGDVGSTYPSKLVQMNSNVVKITFTEDIPDPELMITGFYVANEHNFSNMTGTKFYSYNTIWKRERPTYYLSNDKSVYEEPVVDNDEPEESLDSVKMDKIIELSTICGQLIVNGVDVTLSTGTKHFSYSADDQTNLKEIFDLALQTKIPQYYHADGETCTLFSVEDIMLIYATEAMNKLGNITYCNQMKQYINSLDDIDEIKSISYGDELTGTYLETYNAALAQATQGMVALQG